MNSNVKNSYKNNKDDFNGIWNRENKPSVVSDTAEKLYEEKPALGLKSKKVKPWGIRSIVLNFFVLIATQVLLSLVFLAVLAI